MQIQVIALQPSAGGLVLTTQIAGRDEVWAVRADADGLEFPDPLSDLLSHLQLEAPERRALHSACFEALKGQPPRLPLVLGHTRGGETAMHALNFGDLLELAHEMLTPEKALTRELWPFLRGVKRQDQAIAVLGITVAAAWRERPQPCGDEAALKRALGRLLSHAACPSWKDLDLQGPLPGEWDRAGLWADLVAYLQAAPRVSVVDFDRSLGDQPLVWEPHAWRSVLLFATLDAWGLL